VTNSALLERVPGLHPDNLVRDVGLQIDRLSGSDTFWLSPCGNLFDPRKPWATQIPLTPLQVFRYVEECRKQWQDAIIDASEPVDNAVGGRENGFPFRDAWDHCDRPEAWVRLFGAGLAEAGAKLFFHLFEERAGPVLARVAARLREGFRERELTLTVTSDSFFVPWGMLYVHPEPGKDLDPGGDNWATWIRRTAGKAARAQRRCGPEAGTPSTVWDTHSGGVS
jgi:hypothetical protein